MELDPANRVQPQVHRLFNFGALGNLPDAQLLDRFLARRDESAAAAFEELVIRHGPMVLRVCRAMLGDAHEAEDAFQAVFLVLANRAGAVRRSGSLGSWLFGVAQHVASRNKRSAGRRRALHALVAARTPERYVPAKVDPDWVILHGEIDRLPAQLRAPIVLYYLEGLSYDAVARELGISADAVRGRLARARERLRRRLVRRGVTLSAGFLACRAASYAEAAVPPSLIHSTVRIALGFTAGNAAEIFARGFLNMVLLTQIRVTAIAACVTIVACFSAWHALSAADENAPPPPDADQTVQVQLVHPEIRKIQTTIAQATVIEASARTSLNLKRGIHVEKLLVKLGDKVKKGDVLATLRVPGLVLDDYDTKRAAVELDQQRVTLGQKMMGVTEADVDGAKARLAEGTAVVEKCQAEVDRWDDEVKRLQREVARRHPLQRPE